MTRRQTRVKLYRLRTEQPNPASSDLDLKSSLEIARIINAEDTKVAGAVRRALPQIAHAIELITNAFQHGGRLIYVGTGTSGRIAALDAVECPPTFNTPPRMVQFIIAGGRRALGAAVEADEDSSELGEREMARKKPGRKDVVVGISASGRTPFTVAALRYARRQGAASVALTCNRRTPLTKVADVAIITDVGPEVISGSTRMKAGTAHKMVLNMLSSGAMTRLGYVYSNLMVNLRRKNSKLIERSITIVQRATGLTRAAVLRALNASGQSVPVTLLMIEAGLRRAQAERVLQAADGNLRRAITLAKRSRRTPAKS